MPIVIPIVLLGLAVGVGVTLALAAAERAVPDHPPDSPPPPTPSGFPKSTGYRLVDKILPQLKQAADSSGIPLGLLVGWIAKESGGKIGEVTSLGERGLFQLIPDEQKKVGYDDTDRLSSDVVYSINAGLALIGTYMSVVADLGIAQKGTAFYWRLVKLCHTMGSGAVRTIVRMAKADDSANTRSWQKLEDYALSHEAEVKKATKHSPSKWFPFNDSVYKTGAPFGFGDMDVVVGASFPDIVDPLDCL